METALKSGFAAMGKPITKDRRQSAYDLCKEIGLDTETAWSSVSSMSDLLERDKPYEAMNEGQKHLDLTGTYRIMAILLAS